MYARHYTASKAPAMMGCSPYQTRNELLVQRTQAFADAMAAIARDNPTDEEAKALLSAFKFPFKN